MSTWAARGYYLKGFTSKVGPVASVNLHVHENE